jgi:hypothetical protein
MFSLSHRFRNKININVNMPHWNVMGYNTYLVLSIVLVSIALVTVTDKRIGVAFAQAGTSPGTVGNSTTSNVNIGGKSYIIPYQITGNGNKISNITAEKDNTTLLLNIASQSDGKLTVELPRNLIDSKKQGNQDDSYAIFEDGQYSSPVEIKNNVQARTLAIDFDKGTGQIEIAGTKMVPEFGAISAIVLVFTISGMIVASRKYRKFSFMQRS